MLPGLDTETRLQNLEKAMREIRGDRGPYGGTWTPAWTGLTEVGTPTYSGTYLVIGQLVAFWVTITAGGANTTASTAATTFINNLPYTVSIGGSVTVSTSVVDNYGIGALTGGNTNAYTPTWAATNKTIFISGFYYK